MNQKEIHFFVASPIICVICEICGLFLSFSPAVAVDQAGARRDAMLASMLEAPYPPSGAWRHEDFALAAYWLNRRTAEAPRACAAVRVAEGRTDWQPDTVEQHHEGKGSTDLGLWLNCRSEFSPVILEVARKSAFPGVGQLKQGLLSIQPLEPAAADLVSRIRTPDMGRAPHRAGGLGDQPTRPSCLAAPR